MGDKPYPEQPSGLNLCANHFSLLAGYRNDAGGNAAEGSF
jgi:hypothetical protein